MKKSILMMAISLFLISGSSIASNGMERPDIMSRIDDCQYYGDTSCVYDILRELARRDSRPNRDRVMFEAKCRVNGYGDNAIVGPAESLAELTKLCKMSKQKEYRHQTYLSDIKKTPIPANFDYITARCRVSGYGDNGRVGPASTLKELVKLCQDSKSMQHRRKTYLSDIEFKTL
jgi:hypothetical protein